jgi:para-aminobenzoate synthetase / 4-amino-4-deoxychorismate lyase
MKVRIDFPEEQGARLALRFARPSTVLITHTLSEVEGVLAEAERLSREGLWLVGFVSYEAAPAFDSAMMVGGPSQCLPLAAFAAYQAPVVAGAADTAGSKQVAWCGTPWHADMKFPQVEAGINMIRASIAEGEYYQMNYTGRMRSTQEGGADVAETGAAFFESLRLTQPNGYCAHFESEDWQVLSVSPELFFDWTVGEEAPVLTTKPMKGTAPRHSSPDADSVARSTLQGSVKDRAENLMIVDLLRNDLARVAVTGSVSVPQLFEIQGLPTAWQMTSTVQCVTRDDVGLVDVFRALFPCGSITGAPKIAAMRAITALEPSSRGAYCGAIGLIRPGGHATFNVGIRTVTVDSKRGIAECGLGSGITWDSSAAEEYAEWLVKRRFLLRAAAGFELFETLRLETKVYWLLERHLSRLQESAEHFGFCFDREVAVAELQNVSGRHSSGVWRVRLVLDCHGIVRSEASEIVTNGSSAELMVALAQMPIDSSDERLRHKTTQREMYDCHSLPAGAYDTLLWNERGEVTEFTRGNVVVELAGKRVTPQLGCGLLPGTLRAEMLANGEIEEAVISLDDLLRSSQIWFINSVRGMLAVGMLPHQNQPGIENAN